MAWWSVGMDESARPFNKSGVEQPQAPPPAYDLPTGGGMFSPCYSGPLGRPFW